VRVTLLEVRSVVVSKTSFLLSGVFFLLGGDGIISKQIKTKLISGSDEWSQ
jgi:hypothetical protein